MRSEPRIAHVISARSVIGGAEKILIALVREASRRGWSQLVINPFADDLIRSRMAEQLDGADYLAIPGRSWRSLAEIRQRTRRALGDFEPDVIHAHLFHALALVSSLKRRGEKRVLSHQHGRLRVARRRYAEAAIDWLGGFRYDQIIACSHDVRRFVVSRYRYNPDSTIVIQNGWTGHPRLDDPKATTPTAVCVANLRPEKGHDTLLDAWSRVVDRVPSAILELVGGGPLERSLRRKANELGIDSSVRFMGPVDDVWPLLAHAHVFVLPSLHEPFGIVAVEAMAAGLPVIASNVGGLREFIDAGVNGVLVPAGDARALSAELTDLLLNERRRDALGTEARRRAQAYRLERTVEQYLNAYEQLIAGDRPVAFPA